MSDVCPTRRSCNFSICSISQYLLTELQAILCPYHLAYTQCCISLSRPLFPRNFILLIFIPLSVFSPSLHCLPISQPIVSHLRHDSSTNLLTCHTHNPAPPPTPTPLPNPALLLAWCRTRWCCRATTPTTTTY